MLQSLIGHYGLFALGLLIALESAGLPLPGETALLILAASAGAGNVAIGMVVAVAAVAAIVGDAGGYWLGRRGGRPLLERYGRWLRFDARKFERIETFFARHGSRAVFFGRFVGVLRTYTALFAGISRMPYIRFTLFNALGGILWAILFSALGYGFGRNLPVVEQWLRTLGWGILVIIGALALVGFAWRWLVHHRDVLMARRTALTRQPRVARLLARYHAQLYWLRARLTPGEYLGLHLTVGLLMSAGCLWLFGGLAEDIVHRDPLVRFDQAIATSLHGWATPAATTIFVLITDLGAPVVALLGVIIAIFYSWRRQWLHVGVWLAALGGGEILNLLLKQLFARPRPVFVHPLLLETDYSFPSGHAMGSLIVYGMLAYFAVLALRTWRARVAVVCGVTLLVLLIGFSRLYLGVHYFSDVVAGYAAGGVWLSACITGMELLRREELGAPVRVRLQRLRAGRAK
jgi:undecaprenyl-diphosphatase